MAKAYWIAHVTVTDPDQYKHYAGDAPVAFNTALFFWPAAARPSRWKARAARAMWWSNFPPCKPPAIATTPPNTRPPKPSVWVPVKLTS